MMETTRDWFKRRAIIKISHEDLRKALGLPDEVSVVDLTTQSMNAFTEDRIFIKLRSERFPIVDDGVVIPFVDVLYSGKSFDDPGKFAGFQGPWGPS